MRRVLWVSDSPTVETGFGRVTAEVVRRMKGLGLDVACLGWNTLGDPHPLLKEGWEIFPCGWVTDGSRLPAVEAAYKPDLIVICSDPWVITDHLDKRPKAPVVGYTLLDGRGLHPKFALGLERCESVGHACDFSRDEHAAAGYKGASWVAPYGVDPEVFFPVDRTEARLRMGLSKRVGDGFVFGNVNRNAPRKRFDLSIEWWAEWWNEAGRPSDAFLYIHAANDDIGWDLFELAKRHGILSQFVLPMKHGEDGRLSFWDANHRLPMDQMRLVYSSCDANFNTGVGEGFGLPALESMACGVGNIAPASAALGDWGRGAIDLVPCSTTVTHTGGANIIGSIADRRLFVEAFDRAYRSSAWRERYGKAALERSAQFRWDRTALEVVRALAPTLGLSIEESEAA
jgi:glycosyltransferase involved in cell wall biosynthesis